MKRFILGFLGLLTLALVWLLPNEHGDYPVIIGRLVSQVFRETVTPESLQTRYASGAFTILLVPGHDPEYPGAINGNLREADLTIALAERLKADLERTDKWRVLTTRDFSTGEYQADFATYFEREREAINSFRSKLRMEFASLLANGDVTLSTQPIHHNFAPDEVSTRLYGINRWANDNHVDLTLHIHFNDYPGRRGSGKYSGFSIYIPERQLPNARVSRELAAAVEDELAAVVPVSNLPAEANSPIEDQELIAVGANASRISAAFLIEYGYITESQFRLQETREVMLDELARRTARGLTKYFNAPKTLSETTLLPHIWTAPLQVGIRGSREVLMLQSVLHRDGLYPPVGRDLHDCPINGNFGPCVEASVIAFQVKNNLLPINGIVSGQTLAKFNEFYSQP